MWYTPKISSTKLQGHNIRFGYFDSRKTDYTMENLEECEITGIYNEEQKCIVKSYEGMKIKCV